MCRQYTDFGKIGAATLRMVTAYNGIQLTTIAAKEVVSSISSLPAHPDVKEALGKLKKAGYTIVSLTNSSNKGFETHFKRRD